MQMPVVFSDMFWIDDPVSVLEGIALRERVTNERGIDRAIYDDVSHVDVLRSELSRQALSNHPKPGLTGSKTGKSISSPQ